MIYYNSEKDMLGIFWMLDEYTPLIKISESNEFFGLTDKWEIVGVL